MGYKRKMYVYVCILVLEEVIDIEWVYMWDKFGGYLLLVFGFVVRVEKV